ncbi:MAG: type VI secretion system tube protein Hcp [Alphaproteobacteria bacterium]|nr:type VI secretion system tube protein Hcp [Alphaproteobacteria bacterium]
MYLEIDGVTAETLSERTVANIEVLTYAHGVSMPLTFQTGSNTGRTHGRSQHQEFTITKYLDLSSPDLNVLCCGGNNIGTVTLRIFQADQHAADAAAVIEYMTYELNDCIITNVSTSGGGAARPIETVTFNYNKITWTYTKQKHQAPGGPEGSASTYWDLNTNQGTTNSA